MTVHIISYITHFGKSQFIGGTLLSITTILDVQRSFNDGRFIPFGPELTSQKRQALTKDFVFHLTEEAHEVLREVNWKMHKINEVKNVDVGAIKYELIDILKFWGNIAITWGITPEELDYAFRIKSAIVDGRYALSQVHPSTGPRVLIAYDSDMLLTVARFSYEFMDANVCIFTPRRLNADERVELEYRFVGRNDPIPYTLMEQADVEQIANTDIMFLGSNDVSTISSKFVPIMLYNQLDVMSAMRSVLQKYLDALLSNGETN